MKKAWMLLGLLAAVGCSFPFEEDLTALEADTQSALTALQSLYEEGIEADYADLERHASIARTKRFDSVHEPYFRNEFEVLKYHYRQTSRWFELQSYAEWEAQLVYGLEQVQALKHDAEKGLIEEDALRRREEPDGVDGLRGRDAVAVADVIGVGDDLGTLDRTDAELGARS